MVPKVEISRDVGLAIVRLFSDGLVEVLMKEESRVDAEAMKAILDAQADITPPMASLLVDARGTVAMTREAQEMAANSPVNGQTAAVSILVDSPVSTLLGNFFIRFTSQPYPTRVFRDRTKARAWLLEQLARRLNG